ncbi:23977_t:CDS:2 [Cetraspora pellucida]|uniref:23977_t:CDS:1 n=1 Tax=Cetraspora pellucida TaxID=1433469 RepID=A0A9N8W8Q1_9GLOM|nr:23977_t:CDS:2 [Cetraspora pellucida]
MTELVEAPVLNSRLRDKRKETEDPEVAEYFKAKELFTNGINIASKIPDDSNEETLKAHEKEIRESTKCLVEAFLLDEKATEMSPRIMSLAQQYEKLLKLQYDYSPPEEADTFEPEFTRESLILVIWLLFNGKQYQFCIQTLTIALRQLDPSLHPRLLHLRASCYLAAGEHKHCIKDLERLVSIHPNFVDAYNIMGSIYRSQGDRMEATRNFKIYIEKANKDSTSYAPALYALSALTIQNANATTIGNRKQVTQNLRTQQALNYYVRAKEAEVRYNYLYGRTPEMTDAKRTAVALFEPEHLKESTKVEKGSKKEAERLKILQRFFASSQNNQGKKCNSCSSQVRKDVNGEVGSEKKAQLLVCSGCGSVNYCSKECQKNDWKNGHKQQCALLKGATLKGANNK